MKLEEMRALHEAATGTTSRMWDEAVLNRLHRAKFAKLLAVAEAAQAYLSARIEGDCISALIATEKRLANALAALEAP